MNINDFSQLYRRKVSKTAYDRGDYRLELDRVDARALRVLTHVTVENQDDAYDKCRLGIQSGGVDYFLDELITIAAGELIVSRSDILLGEGDVFFAELTDVGRDEHISMSCIGWEQKL